MEKRKFELVENAIEFEKKGFEYRRMMTFMFPDSDTFRLGLFDTKEEALQELKKYNSSIRVVGKYVLVTEVYIEEAIFDEEDELVEGSDCVEVAPLNEASQGRVNWKNL